MVEVRFEDRLASHPRLLTTASHKDFIFAMYHRADLGWAAYISSSKASQNLVGSLLLPTFYGGVRGSRRLGKLLKVTQLVN